MRDLALVPAGFIFSKNGHFLLKKSATEAHTIVAEACLGMKFDAAIKLFVMEIRGTNSNRAGEYRMQKF